jgi:hypothetical protein
MPSAEMLGWLVDERGIEPHVKVFDKSERSDGTFSRGDFTYDAACTSMLAQAARCFASAAACSLRCGRTPPRTARSFTAPADCDACALKSKCCPNMPARKIARSVHEAARDKARAIAKTEAYAVSRRERKRVEMLFAHLKRILKLDRLRLRGPNGAKDEFLLAATAQNLRKLAKLVPFPAPTFAA